MHSLMSNDAEHASMYPLDIYVYTLFGDLPIQVVITLGFRSFFVDSVVF